LVAQLQHLLFLSLFNIDPPEMKVFSASIRYILPDCIHLFVVYFMALFVAHAIQRLMGNEVKGYGRKRLRLHLRYYSSIFLEERRKTNKTLRIACLRAQT
jgi:hypothetical protein